MENGQRSVFEQSTMGMREGAVTLLDVLGWKGIWQRRTDAVEALKRVVGTGESLQAAAIRVVEMLKLPKLETEIKGISDTIALTTYGPAAGVLPFHAAMAGLLLNLSLANQLPLRGAISYGRFISQDNVLLGPAVDEVASWYEAVDWIGVIFTPSALLHSFLDEAIGKALIRPYEVKLADGAPFKTLCVKWSFPNPKKALAELFLKSQPITPDVAAKLANTLAFLEEEG